MIKIPSSTSARRAEYTLTELSTENGSDGKHQIPNKAQITNTNLKTSALSPLCGREFGERGSLSISGLTHNPEPAGV
jgi:hypothetical protein